MDPTQDIYTYRARVKAFFEFKCLPGIFTQKSAVQLTMMGDSIEEWCRVSA